MNTYFDIALNLASERFSGERDKVVDTAIKRKVSYFNIVCSSINELDFVKDLNQRYEKNSCFTLGVHPHNASELNNDTLEILRNFIKTYKPSAVGETGLDFFRNLSSYKSQLNAFEQQIRISIENNLPLFLHQRDAHKDFIEVLDKYISDIPKGVVHCFTGTHSQLCDYLERDLYIGLTGWICDERRNKDLRESIKDIPLDKLMIETDAPYLNPRNLKTKPKDNRNEPRFLPHIAKEVSSLMNIGQEGFNQQVFNNSLSFFEINLKD